ncbi:MAG: O-antigen ligase domain-containing protein [Tannerella sp.]|jgi:hypothetical protein|nr:O-antigen ligase domain-containing protein [Tannerella sp.]
MQTVINRICFVLFAISYVWGIVLYNIIGLELIDEALIACMTLFFLYVMFRKSQWEINKVFLIVLGIFMFYMIYSFSIQSNTKVAIVSDFLIQMKPYLAFFCMYQLRPVISEKQKKLLNQIALVCWFLLLPIGIYGFNNHMNFVRIIGHPTNYVGAVVATALMYFFTSEGTKFNKLIFIGLLSIGILSGRSKFYGFFVLALAVILYFNDIKRLKLNIKTVVTGLLIVAAMLFVAREKIQLYLTPVISGDVEFDYIARLALYATSYSLFQDFFPFGCGFASFGTYYSGVYYSNIYPEYGLDGVWGLSKSYSSFISDTYYPSLAQFGVVGVALFLLFWVYIVHKGLTFNFSKKNMHYFLIILCISGFLLIENIAEAAFTSNKGAFMMLFLGYVFANLSGDKKETDIQMVEDGEK